MKRNTKNMDSAEIKLLPAAGMEIADGVREAVVGSKLSLGVSLFPSASTKSVRPFTHCHLFPFEVDSSDGAHYKW
jgi:hypothetical protein